MHTTTTAFIGILVWLYSQHRGMILGTVAVFLVLLLIIWLQTTAIARRKGAEAALLKANSAYRALAACTSAVARASEEAELLRRVVQVVQEDCGYRMAWIGIAEHDEARTVRPVAQAGFDDGYLQQAGVTWHDTERGRGPTGTAIRTGEPCINPDMRTNPAVSPWRDAAQARGYISNAAFPLRAGGRVLGALTVYATRANAFSREEVHLLQEIADNLAFGLVSLKARRDHDDADRALRESLERTRDAHQRLKFHVSRMPLAYIAWDTEFRVTEWNPAAEHIFGWSAAEAIGRHAFELMAPADVRPHVNGLWTNLLEGDETSHSINENTHKDGRRLWCEWFNAPLRSDSGQVVGVLSMGYDISERKQAEAERAQLEAQLRQSQKMEAVGRLAGGVAHDFNNLLTAILGYAEMGMEQCEAGSPLRSELEEISKAGKRAAGLTRQLLAFSRKQVIAPVVLDLNELMMQSRKMLERLISEDVELVFLPKPAVSRIKADPGQIEQIIVNLAANARDAMPGGGTLTFETANVTLTEEYARAHSEAQPGQWVMLAASDNGQGMTETVRQHLFEPFFTTKEMGKGTGLGLATVYGIVKQNGGFINVYSELGVGTTFKIFFPPVEDAPVHAARAEPAALPPGRATVLLVEDDDGVRELARTALAARGYRVLSARNPAEAIDIFEADHLAIELLISDVIMPKMNGRQLYERLRATKPQLKALFMSGYTENVIAQHGILDAGINFLQKPYGIDQLSRKVHDVLTAP
jgi:two-component system, cell cycle sensor histidine kinase and response regulator CckA